MESGQLDMSRVTPFKGHITISRLSVAMGAYRGALMALIAMHEIPTTVSGGATFVPECEVPRLKAAWEAHRSRPRLSQFQPPPRRPRRRLPRPAEPPSGAVPAVACAI
jgi:hypothetical protein